MVAPAVYDRVKFIDKPDLGTMVGLFGDGNARVAWDDPTEPEICRHIDLDRVSSPKDLPPTAYRWVDAYTPHQGDTTAYLYDDGYARLGNA